MAYELLQAYTERTSHSACALELFSLFIKPGEKSRAFRRSRRRIKEMDDHKQCKKATDRKPYLCVCHTVSFITPAKNRKVYHIKRYKITSGTEKSKHEVFDKRSDYSGIGQEERYDDKKRDSDHDVRHNTERFSFFTYINHSLLGFPGCRLRLSRGFCGRIILFRSGFAAGRLFFFFRIVFLCSCFQICSDVLSLELLCHDTVNYRRQTDSYTVNRENRKLLCA